MKGLPTLTLAYCFGRKELVRLYMDPVLENIDIEEKNVQTLGANTFLQAYFLVREMFLRTVCIHST